MSEPNCSCPSNCRCWDDTPGLVTRCACAVEQHVRPTGCRYVDDVEGWVPRWPGVDGAVMICLTHRGLAPGEAYQDASTTEPCRDSQVHRAPKPRAQRESKRDAPADLLVWAAGRAALETPAEAGLWLLDLAGQVRSGAVRPPSLG